MNSLKKQTRIQNRELLDTYHTKPCLACGAPKSDPAHIRTRGRGGPDEEFNVMPLCRIHHTMQGQIGWDNMRRRFATVDRELTRKGWYKLNGRLWHDQLNVN